MSVRLRAASIGGFALVELLVGAALGLVLLAAIIVVFVGSRAAYSTTSALSRAQQSARTASQLVARELRMAGYVGAHESGLIDDDSQLPAAGDFSVGEFVRGREAVVGDPRVKANSDQVQLRYAGNAAALVRNCRGQPLAEGVPTRTRLYVSSADALMCESGSSTPLMLVDGISDMQLSYGIDIDGDRQVDRHATADQVSDWSGALSVRVALTVARGDSSTERSAIAVVALRNALR